MWGHAREIDRPGDVEDASAWKAQAPSRWRLRPNGHTAAQPSHILAGLLRKVAQRADTGSAQPGDREGIERQVYLPVLWTMADDDILTKSLE
jgi:hypothetical protein